MISRIVKSKKCVIGIIFGVIFVIAIVVSVFDIKEFSSLQLFSSQPNPNQNSINPGNPTTTTTTKPGQKTIKKPSLTTFPYAERAQFYHNTLDVDYFHPEDFLKEPPPDSKLSSAMELLRAKIIRAERLYQETVKERTFFIWAHNRENKDNPNAKLEALQNVFKSSFNCPFLKEDVSEISGDTGSSADEKWVCGFEVFKTQPRPQECVVFSFGGPPKMDFEIKWSLKTDCKAYKFDFDDSSMSKNLSKQIEVFPKLKLATSGQTLRQILKENDYGWLDVLVLDIGNQVYEVLEHFLKDFEVQVLPFAQLIVKFPVTDQKKFIQIFEALEKERLRPFHVTSAGDNVLQYSFFNLRGKHLLLVGEE